MEYLRRTTSAAAGNGLDTTINEHSPAMRNERRRGQRPGHHDQVPAAHNERRRGQRPGATIKYLRCKTSGAAGDGLGTTTKYPRRTTSAAANNGLGTTAKYLVNKKLGRGQQTSSVAPPRTTAWAPRPSTS
jgi:hypothetical protein